MLALALSMLAGSVVLGSQPRLAQAADPPRYCWWHGDYGVCEEIRDKYLSLGGPDGFLGLPISDEFLAGEGRGYGNRFEHGVIYWSRETGAHVVYGAVLDRWVAMGWENGPLGFPTSDEFSAGEGRGRGNHFEHGAIYWSPETGAHEVHGAVFDKWVAMGWENGPLGFPTSDQTAVSSAAGHGVQNTFEHGVIMRMSGSAPIVVSSGAWANSQIGTFNMAGGNSKETGSLARNEAPDALIRSVKDRHPAFVTLQETCRDWSEQMEGELEDYDVAFDPVREKKGGEIAKCKPPESGHEFGNAVLYRRDLGIDSVQAFDLMAPESIEQREMLCVSASSSRVVICSIHLSFESVNGVDARRAEAVEARRILADTYAGYTKFVGGDLNDDPLSDAAGNFYHGDYGLDADGELKEVDSPCGNEIKKRYLTIFFCRNGEGTDSFKIKKIDYLFVSPSVQVKWGDATHATHSDHAPLWAEVTS
jgi:endonuclease/exonuclease/phosphatase family metal-dependent hydrolase